MKCIEYCRGVSYLYLKIHEQVAVVFVNYCICWMLASVVVSTTAFGDYYLPGCMTKRAPGGRDTLVRAIQCAIQMPDELKWNRGGRYYEPNPFHIIMRLTNSSGDTIRNIRFTIECDPADLRIISPLSDTQAGEPVDGAPNGGSMAQWYVEAKTRITGDSVEVKITASSDSHAPVTCARKVWIPPTEPVLDGALSVPDIVADNANERYLPMPFEAVLTVYNAGSARAGQVSATLYLPKELQFAGDDAPNNHTKSSDPISIAPGGTGVIRWKLSHPQTIIQKEYLIHAWLKADNADSSECIVKVVIPALGMPKLLGRDFMPYHLTFDDSLGEYTPNPFQMKLQVINASSMPAHNVSGFLWLPGGLELDPASQSRRFMFGTLQQYKEGDSIPTAVWTVRYVRRVQFESVLDPRWSIGGSGPTGVPIDTINAFSTIEVEKCPESMNISLLSSDSVACARAGSDSLGRFFVDAKIANAFGYPMLLKKVTIQFDNIRLETDSGWPAEQHVHKTLQPGEDTSVRWLMRRKNVVRGETTEIVITAEDQYGNTTPYTKNLFLQSCVAHSISDDLPGIENRITFNRFTQRYSSYNWKVQQTITNFSERVLTDLSCWIAINDKLSMIDIDRTYPVPAIQRIDTLYPNQTRELIWHLVLHKANRKHQPQPATLTFNCTDPGKRYVDLKQSLTVIVDPVIPGPELSEYEDPDSLALAEQGRTPSRHPKVTQETEQGAGLVWLRNHPNPFNPSTTIEYAIPQRGRVRLEVSDFLGRRLAVLVDEEQEAGVHNAVFDGSGGRGGYYICRLAIGTVILYNAMLQLN